MTGPARPFTGAPAGYPGQNGPQQQPVATHPTIGDLGLMPGGMQPQGVVQPQQSQPPQYQNQQLRQANPQQSIPQNLPPMPGQGVQQHPTIPLNPQPQPGYPQQPQYQQPLQQPQYPQQPQAQPGPQSPQFQNGQGQRFEIPDNAIMDGPNVPPELRGRPWGQVRQIYGALASQFLAGRQQPQAQPQQPEPQQPQQPQAGRPQAPREGGGFWSDPEGTIARVVDQRINTAMAPVQQQSMQQAAEQAMRVAASGISDWQTLYPEIIQVVSESGADPRSLGDPRIWNNAADLARGRLAGRGQYQPQNGTIPAPQPVRGPGAYVPAQVAPPVGQFFAEAPTPPQNQFNGPGQYGQNQLTAEEDFYRQKSGMTPEEFVSWRNVIQRMR